MNLKNLPGFRAALRPLALARIIIPSIGALACLHAEPILPANVDLPYVKKHDCIDNYLCVAAPGIRDVEIENKKVWKKTVESMSEKFGNGTVHRKRTLLASHEAMTWKIDGRYVHFIKNQLDDGRVVSIDACTDDNERPAFELHTIGKETDKSVAIPLHPYRQLGWTCGQATLTQILRFRGAEVNEDELASLLDAPLGFADEEIMAGKAKVPKTSNSDPLPKYGIKRKDLPFQTPTDLDRTFTKYAKEKIPLLLWLTGEGNVKLFNSPNAGHAICFVDYDKKSKTVTVLNNMNYAKFPVADFVGRLQCVLEFTPQKIGKSIDL